MQSACFLKVIPSHLCFIGLAWPTVSFTFLHILSYTYTWFVYLSSPSTATLQEGLCFCRQAEQSPLTLRVDDLSRQEVQVSQSTVNRLPVQIQESLNQVNSLNDSGDFRDLETASSSGLSHVLSHPSIVPSYFGKPCRDSGPQRDTLNLCSMPINIIADPSAPDEPTAFFLEKGYARSPTAAFGEPVLLGTGRP